MTAPKSLIAPRNGSPVDHLAIAVPDTRAGVAQIAGMTGMTPLMGQPEPGQFYWSGALNLGNGQFLEIIGPNPACTGFNPFIEMVRRFDRPRPAFWFVRTPDLEAFGQAAKAAGAPLERIETIAHGCGDERRDYSRAIIGPGFLSVRPNVIEWRARPELSEDHPAIGLAGLHLSHPEAAELNRVFGELGIDQTVAEGPHRMTVDLDTPKGRVSFSGRGMELRGLSALTQVAGLWLRHKLGRRAPRR